MKAKNQIYVKRSILVLVILLALSQTFSGVLLLSSFEKLYREALVSKQSIVVDYLRQTIERALHYGKSLSNFYGIRRLAAQAMEENEEITEIFILSRGGTFSLSIPVTETSAKVVENLLDRLDPFWSSGANSPASLLSFKMNDAYYVFRPIASRGQIAGAIGASFSQDVIHRKRLELVTWYIRISLASLLALAVMTTLIIPPLFRYALQHKNGMRYIYWIILLISASHLAFFSILSIRHFSMEYTVVLREKSSTMTSYVAKDLQRILGKNVSLEQIGRVEGYFKKALKDTPEIDQIKILNPDKAPIHAVDLQERSASTSNAFFALLAQPEIRAEQESLIPLHSKGIVQGFLSYRLSSHVIADQIRKIFLDMGTAAVVSLMFVSELLIFFVMYLKEAGAGVPQPRQHGTVPRVHYGHVRPVTFVYFFALDMSLSFLPLFAKEVYKPFLGISEKVAMGLPISVEMLAAGTTIFTVGSWIDRRGWHEPCLLGIALTSAGSLLTGLSQTILQVIGARAVVGLGYGLVWMSLQGFLLRVTTEEVRGRGFSAMTAGLFAGSLCGAAAGGMLAERIGYDKVFVLSSLFILFTLMFLVSPMRFSFAPRCLRREEQKDRRRNLGSALRFLKDPSVLAVLFLSCIPISFCTIGVLNYAVPIYLHDSGHTQSDIARIVMLYGAVMIFFGPSIGRLMDRSKGNAVFLVAAGLLGSAALAVYHRFGGLWACAVSVSLLALSGCFAYPSQAAFALGLRVTREVGQGRAFSLYRGVQRAGQVLGPLVLGAMTGWLSLERTLSAIGIAYVLASLALAVFLRSSSGSNQ